MGKRYEYPTHLTVEGNNGGSFITIEATTEGMVRLQVGETCIRTVNVEISVCALAQILTVCHDEGFQATADRIKDNRPFDIGQDPIVAARAKK